MVYMSFNSEEMGDKISWKRNLLTIIKFGRFSILFNRTFADIDIHVVQNRRVGVQKSHWDKTSKRHTKFSTVISFVCLAPVNG